MTDTEPRTYTEERYWIAGSLHPDAIAALKAQAKSEGAELGPPWLPSEEGVLYGTVTTTTPPRYKPPRHQCPPVRIEASPGNWAAPIVVVSLVLFFAALVAFVVTSR